MTGRTWLSDGSSSIALALPYGTATRATLHRLLTEDQT